MTLKLKRHEQVARKPVLFVIMDGVGVGEQDHPYPEGDQVKNGQTPVLDELRKWNEERKLYIELKAHGTAVGLPTDDDMGNSEVGHNALGAGRVFAQGSKLVYKSIEEGVIFNTDTWKGLTSIGDHNQFHLIGLTSDGNVHSHMNHIYALVDQLAKEGVRHVRVHTLLDGRDVPERSALDFIRPLEDKLAHINQARGLDYRIASGGGRMHVTMDRYNSDWGVVKRGWDAHVRGIPETTEDYPGYFGSAEEAILKARECFPQKNDQVLPSFVIVDSDNNPVGKMKDGDSVVFFNFRGDRAVQITRAFEEEDFSDFDREYFPRVNYAGMLEYDGDLKIPKQYLVPPPLIRQTLSEYLCAENVTQFACAETHKYGHVTYFWNGNRSGYIKEDIERYVEIKSLPTETIVDQPEMKAKEVCDEVVSALESDQYDFVRVNFANGDMCGHTGVIEAATAGVEVTDLMVGRLKDTIAKLGGVMLVTADHGNADEMIDKKGDVKTAHTLNPVPFYIWDPSFDDSYELNPDVEEPQLANIASTILFFLGFDKPENYLPSLVRRT